MRAVVIIWLSYGIFSNILNVIILLMLRNCQELNYSFYKLVFCDLLINMTCYSFSWIKRILTDEELSEWLIPLVGEAEILLKIVDFISQCFYHIQSASLLVKWYYRYHISTNVTAPELWEKSYIKIYIGIIVYGISMTTPFAFISKLETIKFNRMTNLLTYNPYPWGEYSWVMDIQVLLYLLISIIFGIITLVILRKVTPKEIRCDISCKITVIIALDSLLQICVWIGHFLPYGLHVEIPNETRIVILFFTSDMISLSSPYVLLICDSNIRRIISRKLCNRKDAAQLPR